MLLSNLILGSVFSDVPFYGDVIVIRRNSTPRIARLLAAGYFSFSAFTSRLHRPI